GVARPFAWAALPSPCRARPLVQPLSLFPPYLPWSEPTPSPGPSPLPAQLALWLCPGVWRPATVGTLPSPLRDPSPDRAQEAPRRSAASAVLAAWASPEPAPAPPLSMHWTRAGRPPGRRSSRPPVPRAPA